MILPGPVDPEITQGESFGGKSQSLDHAKRTSVAWHDVGLDSVEAGLLKEMFDHSRQGFLHQSLAHMVRRQLVAQKAGFGFSSFKMMVCSSTISDSL